MTFPAIMEATKSPLAGPLVRPAGILAAWMGAGTLPVAVICCSLVFLLELLRARLKNKRVCTWLPPNKQPLPPPTDDFVNRLKSSLPADKWPALLFLALAQIAGRRVRNSSGPGDLCRERPGRGAWNTDVFFQALYRVLWGKSLSQNQCFLIWRQPLVQALYFLQAYPLRSGGASSPNCSPELSSALSWLCGNVQVRLTKRPSSCAKTPGAPAPEMGHPQAAAHKSPTTAHHPGKVHTHRHRPPGQQALDIVVAAGASITIGQRHSSGRVTCGTPGQGMPFRSTAHRGSSYSG